MAFGKHWEWRGFGSLRPDIERRIRALAPMFPEPQEVVDRYLWLPGCPLNLKLRLGDFKIKRSIRRVDATAELAAGLEEWLEDPAENWPFPLSAEVYSEIVGHLGGEVPQSARPCADEESLLAALREDIGPLRVIAVSKRRWQYRGPPHGDVIVELAEILEPVSTLSVGVEDPDPDRVQATLEELGLPGGLETLNYLEALDRWTGS